MHFSQVLSGRRDAQLGMGAAEMDCETGEEDAPHFPSLGLMLGLVQK